MKDEVCGEIFERNITTLKNASTTPFSLSSHLVHCPRTYFQEILVYHSLSPGWVSGGEFRNLERGVQPLAHEVRPKILGLPRPLPVM